MPMYPNNPSQGSGLPSINISQQHLQNSNSMPQIKKHQPPQP